MLVCVVEWVHLCWLRWWIITRWSWQRLCIVLTLHVLGSTSACWPNSELINQRNINNDTVLFAETNMNSGTTPEIMVWKFRSLLLDADEVSFRTNSWKSTSCLLGSTIIWHGNTWSFRVFWKCSLNYKNTTWLVTQKHGAFSSAMAFLIIFGISHNLLRGIIFVYLYAW